MSSGPRVRNPKRSEFQWLDIDPCDEALARSEDERAMRYVELVHQAIPDGEWKLIRDALQRGQLTGGTRFADQVEAIIGRRIESRKQGSPRKDCEK